MNESLLPRISAVWYDTQEANVQQLHQVERTLIHNEKLQYIHYVS